MASYRIEFKSSIKRDIKLIPKVDAKRILAAIYQLASDPRPVQAKKLAGSDLYRLRVGRYRILYEIKDHVLIIIIIKIKHRKNVYR